MTKLVYILGDSRSGSTLLDQLLGSHHSIVSVGEVHHLAAYALNDRAQYNPRQPLECTCGSRVTECQFWTRVAESLEKPISEHRLKPASSAKNRDGGHWLRSRIYHFIARHPTFYNPFVAKLTLNSRDVAADSFALCRAISTTASAEFIVDSSKDPFRYRILYDACPKRVLGVILARDYRATVYSKMKRGRGLEESAAGWALRMKQIKSLTSRVPTGRTVRIRYEDLCRDPEGELRRLCRFMQLEYSSSMLSREGRNMHHIGGSPSKRDAGRQRISLDTDYLEAFTRQQLDSMKRIVGDSAAEWGY